MFHIHEHSSDTIERVKSNVILTYPRNVQVVDFMEYLLHGGYSSVHTRLGFDTEMFTPKSQEYMKEKDEIIKQMRNLYHEKNEKAEQKKLKKRLYKPHKQEDLKSCNKLIYSLRLDGEKVSNKCRVYSKILKLDENNQYDFTVMKPLPIGTFKNEAHDSTDILFNSIENFDPTLRSVRYLWWM